MPPRGRSFVQVRQRRAHPQTRVQSFQPYLDPSHYHKQTLQSRPLRMILRETLASGLLSSHPYPGETSQCRHSMSYQPVHLDKESM
jgi:hypothetical protein